MKALMTKFYLVVTQFYDNVSTKKELMLLACLKKVWWLWAAAFSWWKKVTDTLTWLCLKYQGVQILLQIYALCTFLKVCVTMQNKD